jgi:hypothetical protein
MTTRWQREQDRRAIAFALEAQAARITAAKERSAALERRVAEPRRTLALGACPAPTGEAEQTPPPQRRGAKLTAAARRRQIHPFASVMEGTPVVMALLSYAGALHLGIDSDPEAIPDPQRIAQLFAADVAMLEALV